MNSMLPLFPELKNTIFYKGEVVVIICMMIPKKWLGQLVQMGMEPSDSTLPHMQNELERIEFLEETYDLNLK